MHDTDVLPVVDWNGMKMRDISRRFIIKWIESKDSRPYWFRHKIDGWKSIENVAYDFYGSCDYVWALMVANNVVHPVNDWLKKEDEVMQDAIRKYGGEKINSPHHYEYRGMKYVSKTQSLTDARGIVLKDKIATRSGFAIPQDVYDQVMRHFHGLNEPVFVGDIDVVTNIEYERKQNEKKRIINVIYPSLMHTIESDMEKLF